jgi:hypothetical protein
MIRKTLSIPIYDCKVNVVVTNDQETFEQEVYDAGWKEDPGGDAVTLHYLSNPSVFAVIFKKDSLSPGNIAHEADHLTTKVMEARGLKYDPDNQEARAYLIGFIVDGLHQIIYNAAEE